MKKNNYTNSCCTINWIQFSIVAVLALAITIISVTNSNQSLFLTINSWHNLLPDFMLITFNFIAAPSNHILSILLVVIILIRDKSKLIQVIMVLATYYIVFHFMKNGIGEARPYAVINPDNFHWLKAGKDAIKDAYKSFPSGHTGIAVVFCVTITRILFSNNTLAKIIGFLFVLLVGISRIFSGWHWPLDILGGGLIAYILCIIFVRSYEFNIKRK